MAAIVCTSTAGHTQSFFLARQPILDRDQNMVAYELLFRRWATGPASISSDHAATASIISHVMELGLDNIVGPALAYVNVDEAVLMEDFVSLLPAGRVVLEILETVVASPALLERIAQLREAGFIFALDDVIQTTGREQQLLPCADIIKVDTYGMQRDALASLVARLRPEGKKLLAEKVESHDEFRFCLELGFDYFQGYYFAKPGVLSGSRLPTSRLTIMRLVSLLVQDASSEDIIDCIKQDASLSLSMLRMVNTPLFGRLHQVESLGHALMLLGRRELQRWMQVLLYSDDNGAAGGSSPLLVLAATRGKLLELLVQRIQPDHAGGADTAFTVGIMSLLDTLLGLPMKEVLASVGVADVIKLALQERRGLYGQLLELVTVSEQLDSDHAYIALVGMLQAHNITVEELKAMQYAAYQWSNRILEAAE